MNTDQHTFVFADLAGYTALTEAHGDERAADVALAFCRELNAQLPDDAEDVKMLGDACLLRVGDAAEAVQLGLRLTGTVARRHGFPDVRVGMHTGTAAQRGADWFGSSVNIAARVSALAGPCDVLLTAATHQAAGAIAPVSYEDLGTHELRHIQEPLQLFKARSAAIAEDERLWAIDPVCRMRVQIDQASTSLDHGGRRFHFCSPLCAGAFGRAPERYAREAP